MKTLSVDEFQHTFQAWLKQVIIGHETLILTRDNLPVVKIMPVLQVEETNPLQNSIVFEGDIISPLKEPWSVEK